MWPTRRMAVLTGIAGLITSSAIPAVAQNALPEYLVTVRSAPDFTGTVNRLTQAIGMATPATNASRITIARRESPAPSVGFIAKWIL